MLFLLQPVVSLRKLFLLPFIKSEGLWILCLQNKKAMGYSVNILHFDVLNDLFFIYSYFLRGLVVAFNENIIILYSGCHQNMYAHLNSW